MLPCLSLQNPRGMRRGSRANRWDDVTRVIGDVTEKRGGEMDLDLEAAGWKGHTVLIINNTPTVITFIR